MKTGSICKNTTEEIRYNTPHIRTARKPLIYTHREPNKGATFLWPKNCLRPSIYKHSTKQHLAEPCPLSQHCYWSTRRRSRTTWLCTQQLCAALLEHFLGILFWDTLFRIQLGHTARTHCWDTLFRLLLGHTVRTHCWDTLLGHTVGTHFWDTLLGQTVETICSDTLLRSAARIYCWDQDCGVE